MPICSTERDFFGADFDPSLVEKERIQEECGVVAMYFPCASNGDYRRQIWAGLEGIANRGQHGAGLVITGPRIFWYERNVGKLQDALHRDQFPMDASMSVVGHTRWATQGGTEDRDNLQPIHRFTRQGTLVVAINGNTHHVDSLQRTFNGPSRKEGSSDTVHITRTIASLLEQGYALEDILQQVLYEVPEVRDSAYAGVIATDSNLYAIRDVHGFRPLYWGVTTTGDSESYVTASETDAIERMGGSVLGEIPPGAIIRFGPDGAHTVREGSYDQETGCSLEHIYFRKQENRIAVQGKEYANWPTEGDLRFSLGHALGATYRMDVARLEGDLNNEWRTHLEQQGHEPGEEDTIRLTVEGVPNSGLPAARGFAEAVYLPTDNVLRRIGTTRAFIAGNNQEVTRQKVLQKLGLNAELFQDDELLMALVDSMTLGDFFNPNHAGTLQIIRDRMRGRKMILVDDSIIHGDSMRAVVMALEHLGIEVVMAVSSQPPTKRGCIYGSDLKDEKTMLWNRFGGDLGQMASYIGTRYLLYPSREQFAAVISVAQGKVPTLAGEASVDLFPANGQCGECFYSESEAPRMFEQQESGVIELPGRRDYIPLEPVTGD